jgi:hypothetical protein
MKKALEETLQQVQGERSENLNLCLLLSLSKHQGERSENLNLYLTYCFSQLRTVYD